MFSATPCYFGTRRVRTPKRTKRTEMFTGIFNLRALHRVSKECRCPLLVGKAISITYICVCLWARA